jgi:hypothetical protein
MSHPVALLLGLFLAACAGGSSPSRAHPEAGVLPERASRRESSLSAPVDPPAPKRELLERVLLTPALPGAPGFEARRSELVARAKGEPVVFVRTPALARSSDGKDDAELDAFRATSHHYGAVSQALRRHAGQYARLREMMLREGYLYAEDPDRAFALLSLVGPQHLFEEQEIWIHRGEQLMHARRKGSHYVYVDGPHAGDHATLMHLDRVGTGPVPPALHRDLRSLRYRLHFDQAHVVHLTEDYLVLELRYGEHWITSVVRADGARPELVAELVSPGIRAEVEAARARNIARQASHQSLREAIGDQVAEKLPFDEPKTELGQEDGTLRDLWRLAYLAGHRQYDYNLDTYRVFTEDGAPKVPQVCIDFIVDTFERASGTWWNDASGQPERQVGGLDLREFGRAQLRRTDYFVTFARQHADWFEVRELSESEQVEMGNKRRFFAALARHVDDYQSGDVVLIRGMTPWDEEQPHTHAFMIYETDPITRIPILVAGNAGPANLWSWETEARRTPLRTVRFRVRPRQNWLGRTLLPPVARDVPPPLVPRARTSANRQAAL